jgi:hypothetical protein
MWLAPAVARELLMVLRSTLLDRRPRLTVVAAPSRAPAPGGQLVIARGLERLGQVGVMLRNGQLAELVDQVSSRLMPAGNPVLYWDRFVVVALDPGQARAPTRIDRIPVVASLEDIEALGRAGPTGPTSSAAGSARGSAASSSTRAGGSWRGCGWWGTGPCTIPTAASGSSPRRDRRCGATTSSSSRPTAGAASSRP